MSKCRMLIILLLVSPVLSTPQLKLLHIIFSHKLYAPIQMNSYDDIVYPDKLNYQYFLENTDDMSNQAKMNLYNLGVELRRTYSEFLGDIYHPDITQVRTSEYVLSMISAQLVNAGLWPPSDIQKWNDDLDWQPVVSDYQPIEDDTLLLGYLCPSYVEQENIVNKKWQSDVSMYKTLFNYVSENYGKKVESPSDVALIYSILETIRDNNGVIPSWANDIFPIGELMNVTLLSYELQSNSKIQKILNGGNFISKIIDDTIKFKNNHGDDKIKLYLYSGEEKNLQGIMQSLNIWIPHILSPGASLVFEIYFDSFDNKYSIKINYRHSIYGTVIPMKLPNCQEYCELDKFINITRELIPDDEMALCHRNQNDDKNSATIFTIDIFVFMILANFYLIFKN